ncbi:MAG: ABC transporter permease [Actinomycetia bacterium]|nr:ABC transporter permease [Actinomycetes bacterium]
MSSADSVAALPEEGKARVKTRGASGVTRFPFVSAVVLALVLLVAIAAPFIAPHDPEVGQLSNKLIPPMWQEGGTSEFPMGTDTLGRDIFTRILFGTRISLMVAVLATGLAGVLGTIVGLIAGFYRGWMETILMRLTDITLAFPLMLMAIVLVSVLGASLTNVLMVIVFLLWPYYARQIRGEALAVSELDFVDLARVAGVSNRRILWRHILPNVMPSIGVLATLQVALIILLEASLSFLGVGIPPPTPAWGLMVADGRDLLGRAWWVSIIPGIAIFAVVLSANLFGDWVRDRFDPKLRQI